MSRLKSLGVDIDEQRELKQRLMDELSGSGEAISLAQLLAAQKNEKQ